MKNKKFTKFYLFSVIGVLIASVYPLFMGVRVVSDMLRDGEVLAQNYPKYIIPYTPISLAVIFGVLVMPLAIKYLRKWAFALSSALSLGVFFASELLLESKVIVTDTLSSTLESWQMFMCYIPRPEKHTAIEILIGDYSPTFKIHFYVISVVLIITILNCFYGFGNMILGGSKKRLRALIMQSAASAAFLGMCIWACFTAFYRSGELTVSPLSALLMSTFFILFGIAMGIFAASYLGGRGKFISVVIPSVISVATSVVMYVGETFLLSGELYRFGEGAFFEGLGALVLAPVDILVVVASGALCAILLLLVKNHKDKGEESV